jgi:hypothetical protein
MEYGSWEEVRQSLIDGLDRCDYNGEHHLREKAIDLLDGAAQSARSGKLVVAAQYLMDYRYLALREIQAFWRNWDQGIVIFSEAITLIGNMSSDKRVPAPYQRLLDARPSLRWDSSLTHWQREFWYGSPDLCL